MAAGVDRPAIAPLAQVGPAERPVLHFFFRLGLGGHARRSGRRRRRPATAPVSAIVGRELREQRDGRTETAGRTHDAHPREHQAARVPH